MSCGKESNKSAVVRFRTCRVGRGIWRKQESIGDPTRRRRYGAKFWSDLYPRRFCFRSYIHATDMVSKFIVVPTRKRPQSTLRTIQLEYYNPTTVFIGPWYRTIIVPLVYPFLSFLTSKYTGD